MVKITLVRIFTLALISSAVSQSKKEDGKGTKARIYRKGDSDKRNKLSESDTDNEYSRSGSAGEKEYEGKEKEGVNKDVWAIAGNETPKEVKQKKWNGNDEDTNNKKKYVNTAIIGNNGKTLDDVGREDEGEDDATEKKAADENNAVEGRIDNDLKNTDSNHNFDKYEDKINVYNVVDTGKLIAKTKNEPYPGDNEQKIFWPEGDEEGKKNQTAEKPMTTKKIRKTSIVTKPPKTKAPETEAPKRRPGKPIGAEIIDTGTNSVDLKWDPPPEEGGSPITGYKVECQESGKNFKSAKYCGPDEITTTVDGLKDGKEYVCRIRAINDAGPGEPSDATMPVTTKPKITKPGKLTGLKLTPNGFDKLDIEWIKPDNDDGNPITGYKVECMENGKKYKPVKDCGPNETMTTIDGLKSGTEYTCRVRAVSDMGPGEPSEASMPTNQPTNEKSTKPNKPTGVKVTNVSPNSLDIEWAKPTNDGGNPITGYQVECKKKGNDYEMTNECGPNETKATVMGLKDVIEYQCRVRAVNNAGASEPSEITSRTSTIKKATVPGKSKGFKIMGVGTETVALQWDVPNDGGSPIAGYSIEAREIEKNWEATKYCGPDDTTASIDGLKEETQYEFRIRAINGIGPGDFSDATVPTKTKSKPKAPSKPMDFDITKIGINSCEFKWTKPEDGGSPIKGYIIEMKEKGMDWEDVKELAPNDKSAKVEGLKDGTNYEFRIRCINDVGPGEPSKSVTIRTKNKSTTITTTTKPPTRKIIHKTSIINKKPRTKSSTTTSTTKKPKKITTTTRKPTTKKIEETKKPKSTKKVKYRKTKPPRKLLKVKANKEDGLAIKTLGRGFRDEDISLAGKTTENPGETTLDINGAGRGLDGEGMEEETTPSVDGAGRGFRNPDDEDTTDGEVDEAERGISGEGGATDDESADGAGRGFESPDDEKDATESIDGAGRHREAADENVDGAGRGIEGEGAGHKNFNDPGVVGAGRGIERDRIVEAATPCPQG